MNYLGKIDLQKLVGVERMIINGRKYLCIPIEANPTIYVGEKGAYLNIKAIEKESTFADRTYSHFIATTLPKELREKYSPTEKKLMAPIIGNLQQITPSGGYEQLSIKTFDDLPE